MRDGTQTKERIERAALELFARQGVAETSMREIAREAGMSLGAMYNHYKSKDDLAWSLFAESFSEIGREMRKLAIAEEDLERKLRAMVGYLFSSFDEDWALMSYAFSARHEYLRRVTSRLQNPYIVIRTVLVEAMKQGRIRRIEPELATAMVTGAIIQVIEMKVFGRLKGKLASRADDVAASCLGLLSK